MLARSLTFHLLSLFSIVFHTNMFIETINILLDEYISISLKNYTLYDLIVKSILITGSGASGFGLSTLHNLSLLCTVTHDTNVSHILKLGSVTNTERVAAVYLKCNWKLVSDLRFIT